MDAGLNREEMVQAGMAYARLVAAATLLNEAREDLKHLGNSARTINTDGRDIAQVSALLSSVNTARVSLADVRVALGVAIGELYSYEEAAR